jgi:hypothetical protein
MSTQTSERYDEYISRFPIGPERDAATRAYVDAHGVRLALTPATRRVGCSGCRDGDNVRHPELRGARCHHCPVDLLRAGRGAR